MLTIESGSGKRGFVAVQDAATGIGPVANQEAIEEIAAEPFENGSYDELPF